VNFPTFIGKTSAGLVNRWAKIKVQSSAEEAADREPSPTTSQAGPPRTSGSATSVESDH
jgi:hypothetical protein